MNQTERNFANNSEIFHIFALQKFLLGKRHKYRAMHFSQRQS